MLHLSQSVYIMLQKNNNRVLKRLQGNTLKKKRKHVLIVIEIFD